MEDYRAGLRSPHREGSVQHGRQPSSSSRHQNYHLHHRRDREFGDENTTWPATHMENPMSAQKVEQTKGESCQFLTLLFHLFPSFPRSLTWVTMDTAWQQPHSLPVHSASPQDCVCVSAVSGPRRSVSVGGKTPAQQGGRVRSTFLAPGQPDTG